MPGDSLEYKYCINIVRFVWLMSCSVQWKINVGDEWIQLHVFRTRLNEKMSKNQERKSCILRMF